MHNLITMSVLFLEHHDKYCSRTIIETFVMSQFCKTRNKARKNMDMEEVILLTSKYDSPTRQPKKTEKVTTPCPHGECPMLDIFSHNSLLFMWTCGCYISRKDIPEKR